LYRTILDLKKHRDKRSNEIKENEKFTVPLDQTLALAYSFDTLKENIIE
jgi:aspartate aminotransferase-like enzyme